MVSPSVETKRQAFVRSPETASERVFATFFPEKGTMPKGTLSWCFLQTSRMAGMSFASASRMLRTRVDSLQHRPAYDVERLARGTSKGELAGNTPAPELHPSPQRIPEGLGDIDFLL